MFSCATTHCSPFSLSPLTSSSSPPRPTTRIVVEEMGLTSNISDVGSDSIPILLVATAACCVSYLRSLFLQILHPFFPQNTRNTLECTSELAVLFDQLNSQHRPFLYSSDGSDHDLHCVVCLCPIGEGDSVRRLSCSHVFHRGCVDGWFRQMRLGCPLCRYPVVGEDRRLEVERRVSLLANY